MAFVFKKGQSYIWPVKFEYPKDGGEYQKADFQAVFNRIPQSQLNKLVKDVESGSADVSDKSFVKDILKGWRDLKSEDGSELEFSQENLEEVIEYPGIASAIVTAYLGSIAGVKIKN